MNPKLSILVINYNQAKFLPESLDSILNQTRQADEIIITDDASTDESIAILKSYQSKYPRLKIVLNQKNVGVQNNVNRAAELATGDYITILAADDLLLPACVERQFNILQKNQGIGLSCSDLAIFEDRLPYRFELYQFLPGSRDLIFSPKEFVLLLRNTQFLIASCGCFYNRKLFIEYGGYLPDLKCLCDYYINYQIAFRHPVGYAAEPFGSFRIVSNSYGSLISKDFKQRYIAMSRLLSRISQSEDVAFRKAFLDSRILSYNGLFMVLCLSLHPLQWNYLVGIVAKTWRQLIRKSLLKIMRKKIPLFSFPSSKTFSGLLELEKFNSSSF